MREDDKELTLKVKDRNFSRVSCGVSDIDDELWSPSSVEDEWITLESTCMPASARRIWLRW